MSIKLSKNHGVNPSLEKCFWCGETKGIVLCGRIHREKGDHTDVEAPKEMVVSLEPCDACKEKFGRGVQVIEVTEDGSRFNDNPTFALKDSNGVVHYPTGRFVLLRASSVKNGKAGGKILCGKEVMDDFMRVYESQKEGKE